MEVEAKEQPSLWSEEVFLQVAQFEPAQNTNC